MSSYLAALRGLNRNVVRYLLAASLLGFGFDGGVFSVLFNLYLLRMGYGPELIGQVASVGLFAFASACLPAGPLGTRWGYRRIMILGMAMMASCGITIPLTALLPAPIAAPAIMGVWAFMYTGMAFFFVNAVPFVLELCTNAEERAQAFSLQTAILALAAFTGSVVGGLLPRLFAAWLQVPQELPLPYRLPLILASFMILPAIWIILRIRHANVVAAPMAAGSQPAPIAEIPAANADRPTTPPLRALSPVLVTIVLLCAVRFFQVSGVATTSTFFNVYMDTELDVATSNIGLIVAAARLLGVPAALLTPYLVMRWGAPRTVVIASLISTVALIPLALIPHWAAAGLGMIGVTALASMRFPAFMIYSMSLVPPASRASLAGAGEFAGGMAFGALALAGGFVVAGQGFPPLFLMGSGLTLIGTLLFYLWFMFPRDKRVPVPA